MDEMVQRTQIWLNQTYYLSKQEYIYVDQDGITGWSTIKALIQALQFELMISPADGVMGPATLAACPTLSASTSNERLIYILQGALYCKGYSPNGLDGAYGSGVTSAIIKFKTHAGLSNPDGVTTPVILKALLNMDAFINVGDANIRIIQQRLNRDYSNIYGSNLGLIPCDGIYSKATNKALLYGLQIEEGSTAPDGIFGPNTLSLIPTLSVGSTKTKFILILQYGLYVNMGNDYDPQGFNGIYDTTLKSVVTRFQSFAALGADGIAGKQTMASLLVSTGDKNRKGTACDCITTITPARALALKSSGYQIVGRYLTESTTLSKKIKPGELNTIFSAGLKVFPIYQTSGNGIDYFNASQGSKDALLARKAAQGYGFKDNTIIYFSVDFDARDDQVTSNIIPHFRGIFNMMNKVSFPKYRIGIYGPRNICSRVSKAMYAESSFVCDMSTGFSGNLGYPLPTNWAFDQISTIKIGSGEGLIEIDNNIASGKESGVSSVDAGGNLDFLTQNPSFFSQLDTIYNIALEYTNGDINSANKKVVQYYRKNHFYGTAWDVVAGPIDNDFVALVDSRISDFVSEFIIDPVTGVIMDDYDIAHLTATTNSYLYLVDGAVPAEFAGWAGDLLTVTKDAIKAYNAGQFDSVRAAARDFIGTTNEKGTFDIKDLIADVDAVNIAFELNQAGGRKLNELIRAYYEDVNYGSNRYSLFVANKFGTLSNVEIEGKRLLTAGTPLDLVGVRAAFKFQFAVPDYTEEQGEEVAKAFGDILEVKLHSEI
ncbi:DUF1906 domain-containing protein [Paenibacillus sp. 19GGS1-52]|uniref:glycoside hydrolase domain-containing protein n=1 Tax=Paenibacillus sp. 19GGS1-52 TaxID=2758563 RepID=UPI001EFBA658|nr:glycoside hydrolase domain-containing protein [Paenibacillus sp. 19GGS1-52]ULO04783.1 DUF1906 domain-containing protein [Paenibacillus sp. 19GGS1-52]